MTYDLENSTFSMDRTASGLTDFNKDFPAITVAPCPAEAKLCLRLFVDRCSVEAFEGDGRCHDKPCIPTASLHYRFRCRR